jgi:PAS domain
LQFSANQPILNSGQGHPILRREVAKLDVLPAIQLAKYMIETGPHIPSEPQGGLDARFCKAMDAAPVMIWVSGGDKLCIWFNRPWLEFTGAHDGARTREWLGGRRSSGGF